MKVECLSSVFRRASSTIAYKRSLLVWILTKLGSNDPYMTLNLFKSTFYEKQLSGIHVALKCQTIWVQVRGNLFVWPELGPFYLQRLPACSHNKHLIYTASTVKPVLSSHSKSRPKLFFKIDYCLIQVKSIAECSKWPLKTGFTVV